LEDYEVLNFGLSGEEVLIAEDNGKMNDWWTMYFDAIVNIPGQEAGVVIISPKNKLDV
jgi:hypothetical protein